MRASNLRVLRDYLRDQAEDKLINEIGGLESPRQLRILWAAGLSSPLQKAVTDRLGEVS